METAFILANYDFVGSSNWELGFQKTEKGIKLITAYGEEIEEVEDIFRLKHIIDGLIEGKFAWHYNDGKGEE